MFRILGYATSNENSISLTILAKTGRERGVARVNWSRQDPDMDIARVDRVERTVALEIARVLARAESLPERQRLLRLHRELLRTLESAKVDCQIDHGGQHASASGRSPARALMIGAIDTRLQAAVRAAAEAFRCIASCAVTYELVVTRDEGGEPDEFSWNFDELPFLGAPLEALEHMLKLGEVPLVQQLRVGQLLAGWIELKHAKLHLTDTEETLQEQQTRHERLKRLETAVQRTAAQLPNHLVAVAIGLRGCFQFVGSGGFPLAVSLPGSCSDEELLMAALSLEHLATELTPAMDWQLEGEPRIVREAKAAWQRVAVFTRDIRLYAVWRRALTAPSSHGRCEICYRYRATSSRCRTHHTKGQPGGTGSESRDSALGKRVRPHYLQRMAKLGERTSVRASYVGGLEWLPRSQVESIEQEARTFGVPDPYLTPVAELALQLRRLRRNIGDVNEDHISSLFGEVVAGLVAFHKSLHPLDALGRTAKLREQLLWYYSLQGFFTLWWTTDRSRVPEALRSFLPAPCGFDAQNPAVRGALSEQQLRSDLLHHRGWAGALQEFMERTRPDHVRVQQLLQYHSLREVAALLGCSHETVRRLRNEPSSTARRNYTAYVPIKN